jgi:hypothetical protein
MDLPVEPDEAPDLGELELVLLVEVIDVVGAGRVDRRYDSDFDTVSRGLGARDGPPGSSGP